MPPIQFMVCDLLETKALHRLEIRSYIFRWKPPYACIAGSRSLALFPKQVGQSRRLIEYEQEIILVYKGTRGICQ